LPTHYAEIAERNANATRTEVDDFVSKQMLRLREQFVDGTNLEREIFFTASRKSSDGRAKFDGCATCHEVTLNAAMTPTVTAVSIPDRWMIHARFNHAKHTSVVCTKCHDAMKSTDTGDVIMPAKATCVECHSPKGRVASDCSFCHSYHATTRNGFGTQELRNQK
jgi:predicted CXXCH cytochrome family protein